MAKSFSETDLLKLFVHCAEKELPECRLFRRNVGAAKFGSRWVRFGVPGQGDAYGIIRGSPARLVEIECKALRGAMGEHQKAWRDWCVSWGVEHLELRPEKGETAYETVARWVGMLKAVVRGKGAAE